MTISPDRERNHSEVDGLLEAAPVVLVFLSNTNELQRFVLAGALNAIEATRRLHYVVPADDAEKMRSAAGGVLRADNSTAIAISPERFKKWIEVFNAACVRYASRSPSFALRVGLDVDPSWRDSWRVPRESIEDVDRAFEEEATAILAGMEPLPELRELFDRHNPLYCVVPTSLLDTFCNEVVWAAATEQVACVLLQSGWDNLSSKGVVRSRRLFLGCWGPQSKVHAKAIQRLPSRFVEPIGAPHYEFLKPARPDEVQELRRAFGVGDGVRLVLFGGSFRQFDETSALRTLDDAIESGVLCDVRVLYRPHPWRAARKHEEDFFRQEWRHVVFDPDMRDRYQHEQAERGYIKRTTPMYDMAYLSRVISACDAVISPMSTLLVESLILDKPTMAVAFGDGKHRYNPGVSAQMTHFAELRQSRAVIWCDAPERFIDDCKRLLKPGLAEAQAPRRAALLEQIVTRAPGSYADRLAAFCTSHVDSMAQNMRGKRLQARRGSISHTYGADLIAREYCGIRDSHVEVPGYWIHGWYPRFHNVHPLIIALHKKRGQRDGYAFDAQLAEDREHVPQWVHRPDQAAYLAAHGYRHVRAIGLPFVYVPAPDVRRMPGSLLVMPPHSHNTHGPDDPLAEAYADAVLGLRSRFDRVVVGLNEDDISHSQWVESFRRRGIEILMTTDQTNRRTLERLRRILGMFEYVTTNGFGSHIAMAAYCGAKVSIYGPFADFPLERMKSTHAVKMMPELLELAYSLCTEQALRQHYPFLFVEPDQAIDRQPWGAEEVGDPYKATPAELRQMFGWSDAVAAAPIRGASELTI